MRCALCGASDGVLVIEQSAQRIVEIKVMRNLL
jgi:hypothetical protein